MNFEREYFAAFDFKPDDIKRYPASAIHDLEIARKDSIPEVKFTYSYQALIKTGIALLAQVGKVKVRSKPGHHVKILEKMSETLGENDVAAIGNAMRLKRNTDLYGGGELTGEKEAVDYLAFVETVVKKTKKIIDV